MERFQDVDTTVLEGACITLRNLAMDDVSSAAIAARGGITACARAMAQYPDDSKLQVMRPSSFIRLPPSSLIRPPLSFIRPPPSSVFRLHLSSVLLYPLSFIRPPLSSFFFLHLSSLILIPSSFTLLPSCLLLRLRPFFLVLPPQLFPHSSFVRCRFPRVFLLPVSPSCFSFPAGGGGGGRGEYSLEHS